MEQTLQALVVILLKSIPTICLLLLLFFYLKAMLFAPLEKVLKQREELTEGARRAAEQSLAAADRKQQEYEARFREARAEVYRAQEETRKVWLSDQTAQIADARRRSEEAVGAARQHRRPNVRSGELAAGDRHDAACALGNVAKFERRPH